MRGWLVAVMTLAACRVDGRRLATWGLDGDEVTLPSTRIGALPMREMDFVLRADVALAPEEQGHELTVVFDCFHGALGLTVDGVAIPDTGDNGVGEHVFALPATLTSRGALALAATAHRDGVSVLYGFGAAPRMTIGPPSHAIARFDRAFALTEMVVILVLGLLYATLYALDRRRSADGAFALQAVFTLAWPLWGLGELGEAFGSFAAPVMVVATSVATLVLVSFLHATFPLGPRPRWLVISYAVVSAVALLGATSLAVMLVADLLAIASWLTASTYIAWRLIPIARSGPQRAEAVLLLASVTTIVFALAPVFTTALGGWHFEMFAVFMFGFSQSFILARHHVARSRALERTAEELQRQVAARSKELADALAQLAQRPKPLAAERVIDGRYRTIKKLGSGGMGSVYEVERVTDGQRLALKRLRGRADTRALARFAREAQIAAELSHANLLPVIDVGVADGELFLVMPLVDGGSLEAMRTRFGDVVWARRVLREIATGLAALHARGIVHRDLKPANVLVANGVARIADFGLAYLADSAVRDNAAVDPVDDTVTAKLGKVGLTRAGDIFGTPGYIAPELVGGVAFAKPPTDLFSFGVIAYEITTGKPAFAEPPILVRLAGRDVVTPDVSVIDPSLREIVARCLDLDPAKRPTATELAEVL